MRRSWRSSRNAVHRRKAINNPIDKKTALRLYSCWKIKMRKLQAPEYPAPAEKGRELKERTAFNDNWLYKPSFDAADPFGAAETEGYVQVELPHTNKILPITVLMKRSVSLSAAIRRFSG